MSGNKPNTIASDHASAVEEVVAAIGGAISTHEIPPRLITALRELQQDLLDTLSDSAQPWDGIDARAAVRVFASRLALGEIAPETGTELGGSSAAASWLRLARAIARRGSRTLADAQADTNGQAAASAYLSEVAHLLLVIATRVEEEAAAELERLMHAGGCGP